MLTAKFLRYLVLPASPTVLFLIGDLILDSPLTEQGALLGIVLALLLLIWLFNYAYVLLEQIANGAREPVLAIEMMNPVNATDRPGVRVWGKPFVELG
jgi:hypothetical protein